MREISNHVSIGYRVAAFLRALNVLQASEVKLMHMIGRFN